VSSTMGRGSSGFWGFSSLHPPGQRGGSRAPVCSNLTSWHAGQLQAFNLTTPTGVLGRGGPSNSSAGVPEGVESAPGPSSASAPASAPPPGPASRMRCPWPRRDLAPSQPWAQPNARRRARRPPCACPGPALAVMGTRRTIRRTTRGPCPLHPVPQRHLMRIGTNHVLPAVAHPPVRGHVIRRHVRSRIQSHHRLARPLPVSPSLPLSLSLFLSPFAHSRPAVAPMTTEAHVAGQAQEEKKGKKT